MRLNRRESLFVGVGALILLVLGVYFLVLEPISASRDKLRNQAARLESELKEMQALAGQYQAVAVGRAKIERQVQARGTDFAPFSYLEGVARESGLTGRIESMTPVAGSGENGRSPMAQFDIRLSGIGLLELVRFIYKLESSDKVFFVVNLNVRPRYLTPDLLDVTLRLASPLSSSPPSAPIG